MKRLTWASFQTFTKTNDAGVVQPSRPGRNPPCAARVNRDIEISASSHVLELYGASSTLCDPLWFFISLPIPIFDTRSKGKNRRRIGVAVRIVFQKTVHSGGAMTSTSTNLQSGSAGGSLPGSKRIRHSAT